MKPPVKLAAFAAALVLCLGLGFGAGQLAGPFGSESGPPSVTHDEHGMGDGR